MKIKLIDILLLILTTICVCNFLQINLTISDTNKRLNYFEEEIDKIMEHLLFGKEITIVEIDDEIYSNVEVYI